MSICKSIYFIERMISFLMKGRCIFYTCVSAIPVSIRSKFYTPRWSPFHHFYIVSPVRFWRRFCPLASLWPLFLVATREIPRILYRRNVEKKKKEKFTGLRFPHTFHHSYVRGPIFHLTRLTYISHFDIISISFHIFPSHYFS